MIFLKILRRVYGMLLLFPLLSIGAAAYLIFLPFYGYEKAESMLDPILDFIFDLLA
jgi:hypothetical protein